MPQFVKIGDAFFKKTGRGLEVVLDRNTLQGLRSGQVDFEEQEMFSGGAGRFSSSGGQGQEEGGDNQSSSRRELETKQVLGGVATIDPEFDKLQIRDESSNPLDRFKKAGGDFYEVTTSGIRKINNQNVISKLQNIGVDAFANPKQLLGNLTGAGGPFEPITNEDFVQQGENFVLSEEGAKKFTEGSQSKASRAAMENISGSPVSELVGTGGSGGTGGVVTSNTQFDEQLEDLLGNSSLGEDEQEAVRSIFDAVSNFDQEKASQLMSALESAKQLSDPFFKAKIRLAQDELKRGLSQMRSDKEFRAEQLANTLQDIREDVETGRELLTLEEESQLRELERNFEQELNQTRNDLAARGFTRSTRRAERERLLNEAQGDAVQSTRRQFASQRDELSRRLERSERDTELEMERIQEVANEQARNMLRSAEGTLGTENLPDLDRSIEAEALGGIPGDIQTQQTRDALRFAQQFVF